MMRNTAITTRGFTLVEMIVSLGIFAIVAVVALGALTKIISANQKGQTLQSAMTNLNFGLDSMSRELRVGGTFHCTTGGSSFSYGTGLITQGCQINTDSSLTTVLAFTSPKKSSDGTCNLIYVYRFIKDASGILHVQKAEQGRCDTPVTGSGDASDVGNAAFTDILASKNINLTDYRLGVGPYNQSASNGLGAPYPRVYIRLAGYAGVREKDKTYFDIQTVISARTPQQ